MRIGRVVSFKQQIGGNEMAPILTIMVGQVVGMMSKGVTVGVVPEDVTDDGLAVKITTKPDVVWVPRGHEHNITDTPLGAAVAKLLQVPVGAGIKDKMHEPKPFGSKAFELPQDEEVDESEYNCGECGEPLKDGDCHNHGCDECVD